MYCQKCGTQLDVDAQFCKGCGTAAGQAVQPGPQQQPAKQTNSLALIGLILSAMMPLAGLIVSIIARKQCIERGEDGERLAKAGIIFGAVYCGLILVLVLVLVAILSASFIMLSPAFDAPILPDIPYSMF